MHTHKILIPRGGKCQECKSSKQCWHKGMGDRILIVCQGKLRLLWARLAWPQSSKLSQGGLPNPFSLRWCLCVSQNPYKGRDGQNKSLSLSHNRAPTWVTSQQRCPKASQQSSWQMEYWASPLTILRERPPARGPHTSSAAAGPGPTHQLCGRRPGAHTPALWPPARADTPDLFHQLSQGQLLDLRGSPAWGLLEEQVNLSGTALMMWTVPDERTEFQLASQGPPTIPHTIPARSWKPDETGYSRKEQSRGNTQPQEVGVTAPCSAPCSPGSRSRQPWSRMPHLQSRWELPCLPGLG